MQQKPINTINMMTREEFEKELAPHYEAIEQNIDLMHWGALVVPLMPRKQSAGGIALPDTVQDAEQYLTFIGKLVKVGPAYYRSESLKPYYNERPLVGDYVLYKQYTGQRLTYRGIGMLLMDDDQLRMVVRDVDNFRIYV